MLSDYQLIIPLFIAVGIGWWLGRKEYRKTRLERYGERLNDEYFSGLNHLIDNKTDAAIESFIKALHTNSETVPIRLALGALFRRRGEVQRSIQLHQDVLASPSLSASESIQAQLALAKDYLAAGLLDRAEMLLLDIVSQTTEEERDTALRLLTDLYQREKEWEKALSASLQLGDHEDLMLFKQQAHLYCELAEFAIGQKAYKEAKGILRRALERDRNCVRASLLLAEIEMLKECYRQALKPLKQAFKQDGAYIPLVVDRLTTCYRQLGNHGELKRCLNDYMAVIPSTSVMLQLAEEISREKGDYVAGTYITEQLKRRPSIRGFNRLIDLHIKHASESGRESLEILRGLTGQLEQSKPVYRCVSCGFSGKVLHWQCPSCRSWESIKPIRGLEGE